MNLDLLKKLTRLANNNPNEHEANSAARRVCKMLEECDWKILPEVKTAAGKMNEGSWSGFGGARPAQTWNDVRRSTEPEFKSKPQQPPSSGFRPDQYYYDEMKNMTEEMFKRMQEEQRRGQQTAENRRGFYGVDWDAPPYRDRYGNTAPPRRDDPFMNDIRNKRGYDPNNKKLLKCTKCGKDKLTGFVGNPATFICMDCVWS